MICLVDVGTELNNQAPYNIEVAVTSCGVQGRSSIFVRFVDVGSKLTSEATQNIQVAALGCDY
jgi:hypothetical protein